VASHHAVTGLALSPDGQILAVAGDGLQLRSTATGQRIGGPLPAADAAGPVALSPDGRLVSAIGTDGKARLWQVATQQETGAAVTVGPGAGQGALAFSPDGKTLATVGANGTAALWSVATQRRIGALMNGGSSGARAAGGGTTAAAAFSPDGTRLATADASGGIRLWDVATQQEIGTPMTAGPQPVYALAFSPDGTRLASAIGSSSGSSSGSARLWDAATQQEIGTPMTAASEPVYAVAFSPDGTTLATVGGGGARFWDVGFPAGPLAAACAIAHQTLTRQQWADYAGTQPFRQVCPAS
jgi:WD40 repeat protein